MYQTKIFFIAFILLFFVNLSTAQAVSIQSKRIVFDEKIQTETLVINNNTDKKQFYDITWLHYKMHGDKGRLKPIPKNETVEGIKWADDMIEISPRELTIPPHSKKEITLSIIPSSNKSNGEYRSHLSVKTKIDTKTQDLFAAVAETGIITPIFIRYGDLSASADIKNAIIKKSNTNEYSIDFSLVRTGNRSIYGSIDISCIIEKKSLKEVYGLAIYTETKQKHVSLNFKLTNELQNKCKQINIKYISIPSDKLFKGKVITSRNVKITDN